MAPILVIRISSWTLFLLVVIAIDWKSHSFVVSATTIGSNSLDLAYSKRDFRNCVDKKKYKITRGGRKYALCDWVAEDPAQRCNKPIIKRKRVNKTNSNGNGKIRRIKVNPEKHCGCTCNDDSSKSSCPVPTIDAIVEFHKKPCADHEKDTACSYNHIWIGCTYEELTCIPITECTCGLFSPPAQSPTLVPQPNNWFCVHYDYIFAMCDPNQPIPPERGTPCQLGDAQPTPRIIT